MLKDKLREWKYLVVKKTEGNNKKNIENLVVFLVLLIITIIAINSIWGKNDNKNNKESETTFKELAQENINSNNIEAEEYNLEDELEDILSNISGVGKVEVLITYSQSSQVVAMYDEKVTTSITEETDTAGAKRNVQESDVSKEIIVDGDNSPITEKVVMPKIEGAIVIAEGADNATIKTDIIQAVSAVTGVSTYKVQVFKMK
ncbi:MAG: stage III sporulation protein AG [Clostridia bacterium]|nr:stage III sporulation protein AG [Clostridia bacterium]